MNIFETAEGASSCEILQIKDVKHPPMKWPSRPRFCPERKALRMCPFLVPELFHTERSHVRTLKVLDRLFYRPLLEHWSSDLVERLFPNLEDVLAWHCKFNQRTKDLVKTKGFPVGNIGDILSEMVRTGGGGGVFFFLNLKAQKFWGTRFLMTYKQNARF